MPCVICFRGGFLIFGLFIRVQDILMRLTEWPFMSNLCCIKIIAQGYNETRSRIVWIYGITESSSRIAWI